MDNEQILEKALETLAKIHQTNTLEAMAKVVAEIPWDKVSTASIGWESITKIEGGKNVVTILPTLNIVMKVRMS